MNDQEINKIISQIRDVNKDYATDPAAALGLVEEMRSAPGVVNIQGDFADKGFFCYFRTYPTTMSTLIAKWADTAPRAICLAWLAWKEQGK